MKFLRNSIFTNPEGWAEKCVGTRIRYRFMQACTLLLAILLFVVFYLILPDPVHWGFLAGLTLVLVVIVLEIPLCYLRAMRQLYMKLQEEKRHVVKDRRQTR